MTLLSMYVAWARALGRFLGIALAELAITILFFPFILIVGVGISLLSLIAKLNSGRGGK